MGGPDLYGSVFSDRLHRFVRCDTRGWICRRDMAPIPEAESAQVIEAFIATRVFCFQLKIVPAEAFL